MYGYNSSARILLNMRHYKNCTVKYRYHYSVARFFPLYGCCLKKHRQPPKICYWTPGAVSTKYYQPNANKQINKLILIYFNKINETEGKLCPGRCTPGERVPGTHWIAGWLDLRAGLDDLEKRKFLTPPGLELQLLCRPARRQSLYRLSYPGSSFRGSKLNANGKPINMLIYAASKLPNTN
jgi:hypothetical protein